jgi:Glycosyl transferase family 2
MASLGQRLSDHASLIRARLIKIGRQQQKGPGVPCIQILMCTLNGAAYLPAQLQSFVDQAHADWALWVSDDGSQDDSRAVLDRFAAAHPGRDIRVRAGPGQGVAANFLSLLADPALPPDRPVAFADQDDVWLPHKLTRALRGLDRIIRHPGQPAVYASRTILTDAGLRPRGLSPYHRRPPGFGNALVQNVLGGNSIVLNPAAVALVRRTVPGALPGAAQGAGVPGAAQGAGVPFHDWWVYLVLTAAGGAVLNDLRPGLLYRQHAGNVLGTSGGARAALDRLGQISGGSYAGWIGRNLAALQAVGDRLIPDLLTPDHRVLLAEFAARRRAGQLTGAALRRLGIYRQTPAGDLLLALLARTGRL